MSISIKFNEPICFANGNQTFLTRIGCLADELFSFGSRRVTILIDEDQITSKSYEESSKIYLLKLAAKISLMALLCLPIVFRWKTGVLFPLVPLSAKMIYKYGYVAKTLAKVEKAIQEKKKQKEIEEEKAKLEKEKVEKENKENLEKAKKLEAEAVEENRKEFLPLSPIEVDQPATIFWKERALKYIEDKQIGLPDDIQNYRRSLKPLTDLMKKNTLYLLLVQDSCLCIEWRTDKLKPSGSAEFRLFFSQTSKDQPVFSFKERKSHVPMMHYVKKGMLSQKPHLMLDNRKEYDIEGVFRANEKFELKSQEVNSQNLVIKKLWSELPLAENDFGPADMDPYIRTNTPLYPKKIVDVDEKISPLRYWFNREALVSFLDDIKKVKFDDRLLYALEAIVYMKEKASDLSNAYSTFQLIANTAINRGNTARRYLFQDKNQVTMDDISQKIRYPKLVKSQWNFSKNEEEKELLKSQIDKLFAPIEEGHHHFAIMVRGKDLSHSPSCEYLSIFALNQDFLLIFATSSDKFSYQVAKKDDFKNDLINSCMELECHAEFYHGSI